MERDMILDALQNCTTTPKCKDCPWESCKMLDFPRVRVPIDLLLAVILLIKEQEKEIENWKQVRR